MNYGHARSMGMNHFQAAALSKTDAVEETKMETQTSTSIYVKDLEILDDFKNRKGLKNRAEAVRVIVEYANAHGALS